jgi:hypothetical protein
MNIAKILVYKIEAFWGERGDMLFPGISSAHKFCLATTRKILINLKIDKSFNISSNFPPYRSTLVPRACVTMYQFLL